MVFLDSLNSPYMGRNKDIAFFKEPLDSRLLALGFRTGPLDSRLNNIKLRNSKLSNCEIKMALDFRICIAVAVLHGLIQCGGLRGQL